MTMPNDMRPAFDRKTLAQLLSDLLSIARVAMLDSLYAIDPRLRKAQTRARRAPARGRSGRVPSIPRSVEGAMPFLGVADPTDPRSGNFGSFGTLSLAMGSSFQRA